MRAHGTSTSAASLWRVGLIALLGLAAAAAQACPQLSVALKTTARPRTGQIPSVRAGKRFTVRAIVTNNGPGDLVNNLVVGITLPDYLLPRKTKVSPAPKGRALAKPVTADGRDLYWLNLSLKAGKRYKYVRSLPGRRTLGGGSEDRGQPLSKIQARRRVAHRSPSVNPRIPGMPR